MFREHWWRVGLMVLSLALVVIWTEVHGQGTYAPPGPPPPARPAPPPGVAPPAPQPQQRPMEYAFRPDLTNPEYGECLQLEKGWQGLWQRYAQYYQQFRSTRPDDPQYQQLAYIMQQLKSQLDTAWNEFSSRCVYFPRR